MRVLNKSLGQATYVCVPNGTAHIKVWNTLLFWIKNGLTN